MSKKNDSRLLVVLALGIVLMASGCGESTNSILVENQRPQIELSAAPQPMDSVFYAVRMQWFSFDSDGRVTHYVYSVDPPADGDTTWVRIERNEITIFFESRTPEDPLPISAPVASSDFHVFVIKAVDNEDMPSPPVFRAFTSYTVAPQSQISSPSPSRLLDASTAPTTRFLPRNPLSTSTGSFRCPRCSRLLVWGG
jgi:hypothetical protein